MNGPAAMLLLADGRFPAGGHAHSGGLEAAVTAGSVGDMRGLELFLRGRLRTTGVVAAALAAAACAAAVGPGQFSTAAVGPGQFSTGRHDWALLDAEADARTPSSAQREASRRQGRALLRAALTAWPSARGLIELGVAPAPPHHPIVLGAAAAAGGCAPPDAALIAAYQSVTGPAGAAVRLLSLDPLQVSALLARLSQEVDLVARQAAASSELPYPSAPALDLLAEAHARAEAKLFAS